MQPSRYREKRTLLRLTVWLSVCAGIVLCISFLFILHSKELTYQTQESALTAEALPFPVGVSPATQTITEHPNVEFYQDYLFARENTNQKLGFLARLQKKFLKENWYQNLASANTRVLVIYAGERKEEVIAAFGDILKWDSTQRAQFERLILGEQSKVDEGLFFPGSYVVSKDATPEIVATMLIQRFNQNVTKRYSAEVAAQVPMNQALVVASLLEREAYTFEDMRIISGVIWNRLFNDMKLQLDATLQYAKGSRAYEPYWWPPVAPEDKYIDSPYNTYQNEGLPPAPIANPSATALLAALNPIASDCLFYFHDSTGDLYCSDDYSGHVSKLKDLYGRGR